MVGRTAELNDLRRRLEAGAVVTVTGKGGVGKSRLALQAAIAATEFAGGRRWVSLAAVADNELVAATAALELGIAVGTDDPAAAIAAELAPLGQALLVLDGCEATRDGVASLVSSLLRPAASSRSWSRAAPPSGSRAKKSLCCSPFRRPAPRDLPALTNE